MMLNRRNFTAGLLLAAMGVPGCASQTENTYVLVHGAWHGAWCWRDVRQLLEAKGNRVITPTLKGLGVRASEMSATIGLDDHISDVVEAVNIHGAKKVIMVGHSYGGMVITGAADRLGNEITTLVYLDAVVPTHGRSMVTAHPSVTPDLAKITETNLKALAADGVAMMVLPVESFGVPSDHPKAAWLQENLTPHPLKTWLDPLILNDQLRAKKVFIQATDPVIEMSTIPLFANRAKHSEDWDYYSIATGHDVMVTEPKKLSEILLKLDH